MTITSQVHHPTCHCSLCRNENGDQFPVLVGWSDVEFRICELIEWVKRFVSDGDEQGARTWATQLAHCGRTLLREGELAHG